MPQGKHLPPGDRRSRPTRWCRGCRRSPRTIPTPSIYVRGDRAINYGRVIEVMGLVSAAGFSKVSLVAEQPRRDKPAPTKRLNRADGNARAATSFCARRSLHLMRGRLLASSSGLPQLFEPQAARGQPIAVELVNVAPETRATQMNKTPPKPDAKPDEVAQAEPPPKPEPPEPRAAEAGAAAAAATRSQAAEPPPPPPPPPAPAAEAAGAQAEPPPKPEPPQAAAAATKPEPPKPQQKPDEAAFDQTAQESGEARRRRRRSSRRSSSHAGPRAKASLAADRAAWARSSRERDRPRQAADRALLARAGRRARTPDDLRRISAST